MTSARNSTGQQGKMLSTGLTETRILYHRQMIDEALADNVLELLEHTFAQLSEHYDWGVVIYLLYGKEDRQAFERWEVNSELKLSIADQFAKEADAEMRRRRASRSAEDYCLERWGYSLSADEPDKPIRCRLRRSSGLGKGWSSADVDIVFSEPDHETVTAGRLSAIVRAWPMMKDRDRVKFVLDCRGALVSPHVDLSQRRVRGRRRQVYLTREVTHLSVGSGLGCDVLTPGLGRTKNLSVQDAQLWLGEQNVGETWNGEGFSLSLQTPVDGETTFGDLVQRRRQTHDLYLRVIGRVLPRKEGDGIAGYAKDWCNVRAQVGRPIQVSMPLDEGFAIAVDDSGVVFIWGSANRLAMELGPSNTPVRVGQESYTWEPDPTNVFWGSLYFDDNRSDPKRQTTIPAERKLAGIVTRTAPERPDVLPLLSDYADDELLSKRGSVQLDSDGSGRIMISAAESSPLRRFFVLEREAWRCYDNQPAVIASFAENQSIKFVFGSSLFMVSANGNSYHLRPHWSGDFDILTDNTLGYTAAHPGD